MSAACSWGPVGLWRPGARRRLPPAPRGGSPGEEGVVTLCGTGRGPFHPHSALGWRAFSRSKAQGEAFRHPRRRRPVSWLLLGRGVSGVSFRNPHGLGSSSRPVSSGPRDLLLPAGHLPRPFPGHAMSPRKGYPRGRTSAPRRPSGSGLLLPHGTWRSQREGSCGHPTAPTRQLTWANGSRFVQNVSINSTLLAYRLDKSLPTLTSEKQPEVEEAINHACFFFLQINGKLTQVGLENHLFGHGLRLLQPRV